MVAILKCEQCLHNANSETQPKEKGSERSKAAKVPYLSDRQSIRFSIARVFSTLPAFFP